MLQKLKMNGRQCFLQQMEKDTKIVAFEWFVEAIKAEGLFNLVLQSQNEAKLLQKLHKKDQGEQKAVLCLEKKFNSIEIICSVKLNERELKQMDTNMAQVLRRLNQREECTNLCLKFYFNNDLRMVTAQTFLYQDMILNIQKRELRKKFTETIRQMLGNLKQFQNHVIERKKKLEIKVIYELNKLKQIFEQNRISRQKSTKICLLSKNSTQIVDKVVMKYLEDIRKNSQLARELYAKYKRAKSNKEQSVHMKKLDDLAESRKVRESSETSENNQDKFTYRFVVKPIAMESETFLQEMEPGGFGQVSKLKCSYNELVTCCVESQKKIDQYLAQNNIKSEKKFVTDILVKKRPIKNEYGLLSFKKQLNCLSYLRNEDCPQIAQYYNLVNLIDEEKNAAQQFRESQFLYSKYYEQGLWDIRTKNCEVRLKIISDLVEGLRFLIKFHVIHRDLKPSNIKLDHQGKIKIIDFGSASLNYSKEKSYSRFCFSPMYTLQYVHARLYNMSEEEFTHHQLYDLYAFGKIMGNLFGENIGDAEFVASNIKYLEEKSMESNPEDRLHPTEVLVYLQTLLKFFTKKALK